MPQLTPDSFAFGGELMSVDEASELLRARILPVAETERVNLRDALGRTLAEAVLAPIDLPPFNNSAVDGYAVAHRELAVSGLTIMPVLGRVAAGHAASISAKGAATRIFTGAPMPDGADTVFMQEDVTLRTDGCVELPAGLPRGANMRPAGEDVPRGALALEAGQKLDPRHVALAAALGIDALRVRRRLRVGIFSTGDEIVEPGESLRPAALYDSNRHALRALLQRCGCEPIDLGILPDNRAKTRSALNEAATRCDLVLSSGGVSAGAEDHVRAAIEEAGALVFWRLAIKPGRPVAMGVLAGTPVVGLPGNPVAVFVTFAFVVRPLLAALAGERFAPPLPVPVIADFAYKKKAGRREFVRVTLQRSADGSVAAAKYPVEGAGVLTSLTRTDGLAEIEEAVTRVEPGDRIGFRPYAVLF